MSVHRDSGFTLTEVLVAFIIVALSLTVMLPIIADNVGQGSRAQRTRLAVQVAESKLAQVGILLPLRPGRTRGEEAGFRWEIRIGPAVPVRSPDPVQLAMYDVTASVGWGDAETPPTVTLRTLRLGRPP